jgi:hypothetical protein
MIENSEKHDNSEYFSNDLNINLELSETEKKFTKAIIKIPLIHVGENDKNVKWEAEVLRQIAPMFRGIVFKYDVNGTQGSSHVPEHLFSPFYDVGLMKMIVVLGLMDNIFGYQEKLLHQRL